MYVTFLFSSCIYKFYFIAKVFKVQCTCGISTSLLHSIRACSLTYATYFLNLCQITINGLPINKGKSRQPCRAPKRCTFNLLREAVLQLRLRQS